MREATGKLRHNRSVLVCSGILGLCVLACLLGPPLLHVVFDYTFESQDLTLGAAPPSVRHWLGTDFHGRDLLVRLLHGTRISLCVGVVGAAVAVCVGTVYGAIAGYASGPIGDWLMRVVDVIDALPYMFLVIVLMTFFGRSLVLLFVALGMVGWLMTARIVRGLVLSLKQRDFVVAARAIGASDRRILFRHILPNTLGPIVVYFTLSVPAMMLQEAFLSFLGLGVRAPQPSLGSLIADGAAQCTVFWWLLVFPGLFMAALLLSLNFLGDGVRDALDPHI